MNDAVRAGVPPVLASKPSTPTRASNVARPGQSTLASPPPPRAPPSACSEICRIAQKTTTRRILVVSFAILRATSLVLLAILLAILPILAIFCMPFWLPLYDMMRVKGGGCCGEEREEGGDRVAAQGGAA